VYAKYNKYNDCYRMTLITRMRIILRYINKYNVGDCTILADVMNKTVLQILQNILILRVN